MSSLSSSSSPESTSAATNGPSDGSSGQSPSTFDLEAAANVALDLQKTQGGSLNSGTNVNVDASASLNASPAPVTVSCQPRRLLRLPLRSLSIVG